jgi:hypothetical protein
MSIFSRSAPDASPGRPPLDLQQTADVATATFALG